jgi:hypothetical protein
MFGKRFQSQLSRLQHSAAWCHVQKINYFSIPNNYFFKNYFNIPKNRIERIFEQVKSHIFVRKWLYRRYCGNLTSVRCCVCRVCLHVRAHVASLVVHGKHGNCFSLAAEGLLFTHPSIASARVLAPAVEQICRVGVV